MNSKLCIQKNISFLVFCTAFLLNGCSYRAGDSKLYDVGSNNGSGRTAIQSNNIKYQCNDVWDIYGADVSRSKCMFVSLQAVGKKTFDGEEFRQQYTYFRINDKKAGNLGLTPEFTWWQRWGWPVAGIIGIVATVIMVMISALG